MLDGGENFLANGTGTFGLKGGLLALLTTFRVGQRSVHVAIVGGTGAYEGPRGSIVSVSRGGDSPYSDDTVRLIKG